MSQTSINAAGQPIAFAGQIADNMEGRVTDSAFNTDPNQTQIPFGVAMKQDPAQADGAQALSALTDTVSGINAWSADHAPAITLPNGQVIGDLGATGLVYQAHIDLHRRGRIWGLLDGSVQAIVPGIDRPYARAIATGAYNQPGAFGSTANASYMIDLSKVGVFRSTVKTAADGVSKIAILDVDFNNKP